MITFLDENHRLTGILLNGASNDRPVLTNHENFRDELNNALSVNRTAGQAHNPPPGIDPIGHELKDDQGLDPAVCDNGCEKTAFHTLDVDAFAISERVSRNEHTDEPETPRKIWNEDTTIDIIEQNHIPSDWLDLRLSNQSVLLSGQLQNDYKEGLSKPNTQAVSVFSNNINHQADGANRIALLEDSVSELVIDSVDTITPVLSRTESYSIPTAAVPVTGSISSTFSINSPPSHHVPTLDLSLDGKWIGELQDAIEQISATTKQMSFRLKPIHLGELSVEIVSGDKGDLVKFSTENENTKAIIVAAQSRLESDIRLGGVKVARIDVAVQSDSPSPSQSMNLAHQNNASSREPQKRDYHQVADNKQQSDADLARVLPNVTARFA